MSGRFWCPGCSKRSRTISLYALKLCLLSAGGNAHGGVPGVTASPMAMLLDAVHWGGRVPLRQLQHSSRSSSGRGPSSGTLLSPGRGPSSGSLLSQGEVPALLPEHGQGQFHRAFARPGLAWPQAVGLDAREDDAEGEGGRKSGL